MLSKCIAAIAATCLAFAIAIASEPAMADGMPSAAPRKVAKVYRVPHRHRVAWRYVQGPWPGGPDPYAYSYNRPGYYPYYNSNYWVPRRQMLGRSRYPLRIPEYYSSWGYPLGCKVSGGRHCGVPYRSRPGDPRRYYRRDVQLPAARHHH